MVTARRVRGSSVLRCSILVMALIAALENGTMGAVFTVESVAGAAQDDCSYQVITRVSGERLRRWLCHGEDSRDWSADWQDDSACCWRPSGGRRLRQGSRRAEAPSAVEKDLNSGLEGDVSGSRTGLSADGSQATDGFISAGVPTALPFLPKVADVKLTICLAMMMNRSPIVNWWGTSMNGVSVASIFDNYIRKVGRGFVGSLFSINLKRKKKVLSYTINFLL